MPPELADHAHTAIDPGDRPAIAFSITGRYFTRFDPFAGQRDPDIAVLPEPAGDCDQAVIDTIRTDHSRRYAYVARHGP